MRHDGLQVGQPFWVIQLFDKEGYYSSVTAPDLTTVKERADKRAASLKGLLATTVPFEGTWSHGMLDVSTPEDFKPVLAHLDRPSDD
jgi:hypothetical protein